jgi:hypothetical protein
MEIINVITIENDVIQEVESFKVYDKHLSDEEIETAELKYKQSVRIAESYFLKKAKEYGWTEDEISESDLLDDGRYETEFTVYANVNLVWSQI